MVLRRRVGVCLKGILAVALVSVVAVGGRRSIQRLIWENPKYAVSDIRFATDGMLTRAQVLESVGLWEGRNIFTVDLAKIRACLDLLPQVERAEVRRTLPDRIDITVMERQPVAWVAASANVEIAPGGNAFLVDSHGIVMRTRKVLPEHLTLPLIVGVHMEDVAPGQRLPSPESLAAVDLLRLSADDLRWQPRVVDVSKGYCLVVTDHRRAKITFGFDALEEQLARLKQLMDVVEPMQRDLQTVNLMLERNVPVTFVPLPPPPVPETKSKENKTKSAGKVTPPAPVSHAVTAEQIARAQAQAAQAAQAPVPPTVPAPVPVAPAPVPVAPAPVAPASLAVPPLAKREASSVPTPPPPVSDPVRVATPKAKPAPAPEPKPVRKGGEPESVPAEIARKKAESSPDERPPKALPVEKPASSPKSAPAPAPSGTLTPNERLRKLFQPHG
jgi:cell division protein FtsQ